VLIDAVTFQDRGRIGTECESRLVGFDGMLRGGNKIVKFASHPIDEAGWTEM